VWAYGPEQTDRHTDTQTRVTTIHFASSTTHAKCNETEREKLQLDSLLAKGQIPLRYPARELTCDLPAIC